MVVSTLYVETIKHIERKIHYYVDLCCIYVHERQTLLILKLTTRILLSNKAIQIKAVV